jgi:hypothetical protein
LGWPLLVLVLVLLLLTWLASLLLLLLLHRLHPRLLFEGLLSEVGDEIWDGHAGFLGIVGELLLHGPDLLWRRLLAGDRHTGWWLGLHLYPCSI